MASTAQILSSLCGITCQLTRMPAVVQQQGQGPVTPVMPPATGRNRIKEIGKSGVVVLQGKCGGTLNSHVSHLAWLTLILL